MEVDEGAPPAAALAAAGAVAAGGAGGTAHAHALTFLRSQENQPAFPTQNLEKHLKETIGEVDAVTMTTLVNALLVERRVLLHILNGEAYYRAIPSTDCAALTTITPAQFNVWGSIFAAGRKGIFKRDLKKELNMTQAAASKALKKLEAKKLVKTVKTIASRTVNLYVCAGVTPSREHTGGPWYDENQEFDEPFVNMVCQGIPATITKLLRDEGKHPTMPKIMGMVQRFLTQPLQDEDMVMLMWRVIYDGEIEEYQESKEVDRLTPLRRAEIPLEDFVKLQWQIKKPMRTYSFAAETPCGVCPVRLQCTPGGVISPTTCTYMDDWLGSDGLLF